MLTKRKPSKKSAINNRNFKKVTKLLNSFPQGSNCWGTTLFVLGQQKNRKAVTALVMDSFIKIYTKKIKKPQVGDILVLRYKSDSSAQRSEDNHYALCREARLLSHTAIYIGQGKYLHQAGYGGPIREDTLKEVLKIYHESKPEYVRFLKGQKTLMLKKYKTKRKKVKK